MSVFVIISQQPSNPGLQAAIKEKYPNDHYELYPNQWLVRGEKTSPEIAEELGITKEIPDTAIVFSVSSYWGRTNPNVWEWLKVKWEKNL